MKKLLPYILRLILLPFTVAWDLVKRTPWENTRVMWRAFETK